MANINDLRYVQTESVIRVAFLQLVAEQPIASITVSAVCERAQISRNAFYLHHRGISELYAAMVEELIADVRAESFASAERRRTTGADDDLESELLNSFTRHEDLLRALLPADDGSLAKCLAGEIETCFVEAALRFGEHGNRFEHRLRCAYSAWAIIGFVTCWMAETDQPLTVALPEFKTLLASAHEASAAYLTKDA